jgi:hypothetical protein
MFNGDDLTSNGIERCRKAMRARDIRPEETERRITIREGDLFDEERRGKLVDWVIAAEAMTD